MIGDLSVFPSYVNIPLKIPVSKDKQVPLANISAII
jgi:hypothetical protein